MTDSPRVRSSEEVVTEAARLLTGFAERTGLTSDRPKQRYLCTDAFAVCNFLGLARRTGEAQYRDLALRLVDQVHHVPCVQLEATSASWGSPSGSPRWSHFRRRRSRGHVAP